MHVVKNPKNPKPEPAKSIVNPEWWAIGLFFIAIFVFVSNVAPNTTGFVGHWIVEVFGEKMAGRGIAYLPIFLVLPAIHLLISSARYRIAAITTSVCFVSFTVFLEMRQTGGGYIGKYGLMSLTQLIGNNGTIIFLLGVFILSALILFNLSIRSMALQVARLSKFLVIPPPDKIAQALFYTEKPVVEEPPIPAAPEPEPEPEPEFEIQIREEPKIERKKLAPVESSGPYQTPSSTLLDPPAKKIAFKETEKILQEKAAILEMTLASFNVEAKVVNITPGPSVTRFELQPGVGVKIAKITSLSRDIALKLAAQDVRIEAPIPGKALVGIEVPNSQIDTITLRTITDRSDFYERPAKLLCAMGLTITGDPILMDLAKMPHVLIAGATGSGKSVCVNSIIVSILLKANPDEVKMLMIDPKKVELSLYEDIPHLIAPVVTDPHKAAATLKQWALKEMERRYEEFSKVGVKDIDGFNKIAETRIPYIVVIIDELADLMMVASQEVETTICRLAQMSRATGIHLVIATQRPSVNVITGLIKANIPSRISFFLQSQIDSRTILDMGGAEKLLGKGDMLYSPVGSFKPMRLQGVYLSEKEIKKLVAHVKKQGQPNYLREVMDVQPITEDSKKAAADSEDTLFEEAKNLVLGTQYASTSYLQRKLRIGYNRAARLMDELIEKGVIPENPNDKKIR